MKAPDAGVKRRIARGAVTLIVAIVATMAGMERSRAGLAVTFDGTSGPRPARIEAFDPRGGGKPGVASAIVEAEEHQQDARYDAGTNTALIMSFAHARDASGPTSESPIGDYACIGLFSAQDSTPSDSMMAVQVERDPVTNRLRLTVIGGLRTRSTGDGLRPAATFRVQVFPDLATAGRASLDEGEGSLFDGEVTLGRRITARNGFSAPDFVLQDLGNAEYCARSIGSVIKFVTVPDAATAVVRLIANPESWQEPVTEPSDLEASAPSLPAITMLWAPRPNPARQGVTFRFSVAQRMQARLAMFDLQGRKVATLVDRIVDPGPRSFTWDRADSRGSRSKSGIYFARFEADGKSFTKRFVLLR